MICPICGTINDQGETSCKICGASFSETPKTDNIEGKEVDTITIDNNAENSNTANQQIPSPPPMSSQPAKPKKSKAVAFILGLIILGGGVCYAEKWKEGLTFIGVWVILAAIATLISYGYAGISPSYVFVVSLIVLVIWIYSLIQTNTYINEYKKQMNN